MTLGITHASFIVKMSLPNSRRLDRGSVNIISGVATISARNFEV
jgi:hypothetical protein